MFTPPAYKQETVSAPGFSGGSEWGGMSFDPKLEYLFANTENVIWTTAVTDRKPRADGKPLPEPHSRYTFSGYNKFKDPDGYPATAAPWGHLTAIDLKTGGAYPEYPEDMRFYALLLTLRFGVPPYRAAAQSQPRPDGQDQRIGPYSVRAAQ